MVLVHKVKGGDRAALNELFERYKPRLRQIVRIRMGSKLQRYLDEDDIIQEVFVVAMDKVAKLELRSQASILQWFAVIALNAIRGKADYYAAEKRDREREVSLRVGSSSTTPGVFVAASELTPSQKALREEFQALVDSYVEDLEPPEYRDVILLRDYYEESWESVRTQLSRPTVHACQELYQRAHRKLRERMRKHLERRGPSLRRQAASAFPGSFGGPHPEPRVRRAAAAGQAP